MNNKIYVIVPFADVVQQMINDSSETEFSTLRHSIEGVDSVVLKWEGSTPASLSSYDQYTHDEILDEMATSTWTDIEQSSSSSSSGA